MDSILPFVAGAGLVGLLAALRHPKTAYAVHQRLKSAEASLDQAIEAERAASDRWINEETSTSASLLYLAGRKHHAARTRVTECRTSLREAQEAMDTWSASVEVFRDVVAGLRLRAAPGDPREVLRVERALLSGFPPFHGLEKALAALGEAPMTEVSSLLGIAFEEALEAAEAWLADPVNVDPLVAPPDPPASPLVDEEDEAAEGEVQEPDLEEKEED
jgi:hypothetical protein